MTAGFYLFGLAAAILFGYQIRDAADAYRRHRALAKIRRSAPDLFDWAEHEWEP